MNPRLPTLPGRQLKTRKAHQEEKGKNPYLEHNKEKWKKEISEHIYYNIIVYSTNIQLVYIILSTMV